MTATSASTEKPDVWNDTGNEDLRNPDRHGTPTCLEVRLARLPAIFKSASVRSLRLHSLLIAMMVFALWLHRRPLARAWRGVDEPLSVEELMQARQWWSGFGLGLSFEAKLKLESVTEAGFERVQWDDFMEKAMGKKGQVVGKFLMLSWRQNLSDVAGGLPRKKRNAGKAVCSEDDGEVCILCFLPGTKDELASSGAATLQKKMVRGSLARLGREQKTWLQKTKWVGDGVLPLLFTLRSPVFTSSKRRQNLAISNYEGVSPDQFAGRRVILIIAVVLIGLLLRGMAIAIRSYFDFTKHPSFKVLKSFPDIATDPLMVAREIDREVTDDSPITGSRVMQGGSVLVTCSWLIHCPTAWTFADRVLRPLKLVLACLLGPSTFLASLTSREARRGRNGFFAELIHDVREWIQLLCSSGLYGVEITRLRDCTLDSRIGVGLDFGTNSDSLRVATKVRLVLKDDRLGLFIEIPGSAGDLQKLAREIAIRQAVDRSATNGCGARGSFFGQWSAQDESQEARSPRMFPDRGKGHNMTLEECCEALGLSRTDLRLSSTVQEAKLLLRRAFRRRALASHPDKVGDDLAKRMEFERATIALEVLSRRLDAEWGA
mmetsp:Transcript_9904/g.15859  ORF Transcript_9904/g.15859 Transcript_9904/m.15859 type:complete len:603 (-) Transcript_9904:31-1839(-)